MPIIVLTPEYLAGRRPRPTPWIAIDDVAKIKKVIDQLGGYPVEVKGAFCGFPSEIVTNLHGIEYAVKEAIHMSPIGQAALRGVNEL